MTLKLGELDIANKQLAQSELWNDLYQGLTDVYRGEWKSLSKSRYMQLYNYVYVCANVSPLKQKTLPVDDFKLLEFMKNFLKTHISYIFKDYVNLSKEELLQYFVHQWKQFQYSSLIANGICGHMKRYLTSCKLRNHLNHNVNDFYQLAMITWNRELLEFPFSIIIEAMIKLINKERAGQVINSSTISSMINCFIQLGDNFEPETDISQFGSNLTIYKNTFEHRFLVDTKQFYKLESETFLASHSVCDYVDYVGVRLNEEKSRVMRYLHECTLPKLIAICQQVLIESHLDRFYHQFVRLLQQPFDDQSCTSLHKMYGLLQCVPTTVQTLVQLFETQMCAQGTAELEKCTNGVSNNELLFLKSIMSVYIKFDQLVKHAFDGDSKFAIAFNKACDQFINASTATSQNEPKVNKSPELLAKCCDLILRKKYKMAKEDDFQDLINQVMTVFKYIANKDVFEQYYVKFLAKRLVQQVFISTETETSVILKFKHICGFEYTSRMQRLIQDANLNKNLNDSFKQQLTQPLSVDFAVFCGRTGIWPFSEKIQPLTLPSQLENCVALFNQFYLERHNGRKLNWLHSISKGELVTSCFKNSYTFQTSTYQMAILLLYNSGLSFTVQQIHEHTQIPMHLLTQVLHILIKAKILLSEQPELNANASVSLFLEYKNKKFRVNINAPIQSEVKHELDTTNKYIEEDRKMLTQATICRIMKARRTLSHQQLLVEVIAQLSPRFKPDMQLIKKCINILIEREYLKKSDDSSEVKYNYMA